MRFPLEKEHRCSQVEFIATYSGSFFKFMPSPRLIFIATYSGSFRYNGMPLPREVLPGRTYMITRRCTQRQFLLRPDHATNNAFIYCLAVAAERAGVIPLFTAAESNHHHTGIFDPRQRFPLPG
jgi:hypothetical protein